VLFNKMQAMMSVVEGYSNHVMNAVGRDLMPDFSTISSRFEQRQRNRTGAEQLFARLTGLDLKLEQYRLGEQFINAVVDARGHDFARRVWDGPETLPTLEELRDPTSWIGRIDAISTVEPGA
jgi:putative hydrolase